MTTDYLPGSWTVQKTSEDHVVLDASGDILAHVCDRPIDLEAMNAKALAAEGMQWIEANVADGSPSQGELR
jgi:hypothetical protein